MLACDAVGPQGKLRQPHLHATYGELQQADTGKSIPAALPGLINKRTAAGAHVRTFLRASCQLIAFAQHELHLNFRTSLRPTF